MTTTKSLGDDQRIVITGIGLASPNGNDLSEFRSNLLAGVSGIEHMEMRHMGQVAAGNCNFDEHKYLKKSWYKELFTELVVNGQPFVIKFKGTVIFDSDRDEIQSLDFQNIGLNFLGNITPYDGLSLKFKK